MRKTGLRRPRQGSQARGFFNGINLGMNEGLRTGMVWGLEVKKTDLVNIKNIKQAALGSDEDGRV